MFVLSFKVFCTEGIHNLRLYALHCPVPTLALSLYLSQLLFHFKVGLLYQFLLLTQQQ